MTMIATASTCDGCGDPIEQRPSGARRRWCSDRCRKRTLYAGTCENCGGPTNGSDGRGPNAAHLCHSCSRDASVAAATWPPEALITEARRWHSLTGAWPRSTDWSAGGGGPKTREEVRVAIAAFREATGPWPSATLAQVKFGSWAAFMEAVGGQAIGKGCRGYSRNADSEARLERMRAVVVEANA